MSTKPKTLSLPSKPEPAEPKEKSRAKSGPGNRAAPRPRASLQTALKAKAERENVAARAPATPAASGEESAARPPRKSFTERSGGPQGSKPYGARTRQAGDDKPFEGRRRPRTDESGKPSGARKPFEKSFDKSADKPFDKPRRFARDDDAAPKRFKRDEGAESRSSASSGRGSFDKPRRFTRDDEAAPKRFKREEGGGSSSSASSARGSFDNPRRRLRDASVDAKSSALAERSFKPRAPDGARRSTPTGEQRSWKPASDRPAPRRRSEESFSEAPFKPAAPTPRKVPDDGKVRVSKLLSERGLCSRREADEYIERGWVLVDGKPISELGTRVHPDQEVTLARDAKSMQDRAVTFLLNKPIGYVSAQPEPGKTPAMSLLLPENRWEEDNQRQRFEHFHLRGLAPAGRLDIDSTGLIVFTQDGRVARRLIGDDSNVEKEYLVRVEGEIVERGLKLLNHGLSLDGEKLKPAKVSWQNEEQLRFVLREGKKRQIRRMCELVGLKVVGLKRIRIGSVVLGKLPVGKWRYLRDDEKF